MFSATFKRRPLPKSLDDGLSKAGVALNSGYLKLGKTHLQRMLIVSAVVHAVILAVRFVPDDILNRWDKEALMVVLVNSASDTPASQAQALANANLVGGGEAEKGIVRSPLPNMGATQDGDELALLQKQVKALEKEQSSLLAALKGDAAFQATSGASQKVNPNEGLAVDAASIAMMREIATLDKQVNDYNARPKRKQISPATRQAEFATYYALWSDRTERLGTEFYPEAAKGKSAEIMVTVSVRSNGTVENIEIHNGGSGNRAIDIGAIRLLKRLAPYPKFSGTLKKGVDILDITTRLVFTPGGGFTAEMQAPSSAGSAPKKGKP